MNPVTRYIIIGLAVLLGLSFLGNIGLTKAYLKARDARTQAVADRDSARGAASACSDAVDDLRELADQRKTEAAPAIKLAADEAYERGVAAGKLLKAPPKYPADACRSADELFNDWLASRRKAP